MNKVKAFFVKRKRSILQLIGSLFMLAIAGGVGIMLGLKKTNDINKYINEAVEYFGEENWVALYQYSEVEDSAFINENEFGKLAAVMFGDVAEEKVNIENIVEKDKDATVKISYKTSDGNEKTCQLEFDKKNIKNYVFFPQWKLDIENMIAKDCKLVIKKGFKVYLDGIELTAENSSVVSDDVAGTDTYIISRIFKGDHVIYLQCDGVEVIEANTTWDESGSSYNMEAEKINLLQSQKDILNSTSKNVVVGMYSAIFTESGTDGLKQYFSENESALTSLNQVYDNMLAAIKPDDGSTLNSIDITTFNYDSIDYMYPDKADVKVSFECTFKARGPRKKNGGVRERYEGTSGSDIILHFVKSGDTWSCESVEMECIDYSKKEEE